MRKPKINLKMIRRVLRHVEADQRRLGMWAWAEFWTNEALVKFRDGKNCSIPPCGTIACMAGWTCILNGRNTAAQVEKSIAKYAKKDSDGSLALFHYQKKARKILGFTKDEAEKVFQGDAVYAWHLSQLATLKRVINEVLADRGMRARV